MDKKIKNLIKKEERRQKETLSLIPSENLASKKVREALGSVFTNKYSEGYPGKRYYPGNSVVDEVEELCKKLSLKVFRLSPRSWAANVQPYSGAPANLAIYSALMKPDDTFLGMKLSSGGHLSHGVKITSSGTFFKSVQYGLDDKGAIDYKEIERLAKKHKPKIIIAGASSYPRKINFKKFSSIAKGVGAYLLADVAHIAGLIISGEHPSCFPWADVVMFTTHKNFHGPRGAIIISKKELEDKINRAVFPGVQAGPHDNQTLAKAVALEEALQPSFKKYQKQVVKNTEVLAEEVKKEGLKLFTGGTDNHLFLIDYKESDIDASWAEKKLESIGILANRNALPCDERPWQPSGQRFGAHSVTTRGMKEKEMKILAKIISDALLERRSEGVLKAEVKKLANSFLYNG